MEGAAPYPPGSEGLVLGDERVAMLEETALQLGIYCHACGLEMSGPGFEFVSLRPVMKMRPGGPGPTMVISRAFVCHREECAEARTEARAKATAVKAAGGWTVLTGVEGERDQSI